MSTDAVKVTLCPPSMQGERFDPHQHLRANRPVSARFLGNGEWQPNSFSFEEYSHAQVRTVKSFAGRRFATPSWATSDISLRRCIAAYLVQRCNGHKKLKTVLPSGVSSDIERIRWAENTLRARVPSLQKQVDSICEEYVELRRSGADPARLRKCEMLIQNLDAQLIFSRQPAACCVMVVYSYYRLGQNSVGVAQQVGMRPPAVRQLVRRVGLAARRLGFTERERIARCSSTVEALDAPKNP